MIRKIVIILLGMAVASCAPVLTQDVMRQGIIGASPSEVKSNPAMNRERLFIMGGIIVKTTATKEGSLIEALYVPVDSRGYLKSFGSGDGRFLALHRGQDILDPMIFRKDREITVAGVFIGTRQGKIDDMDYVYPLYEIKEIYLWEEVKERYYYMYPPPYYPPPYYPSPYYRYRYYNPYYPWWYY